MRALLCVLAGLMMWPVARSAYAAEPVQVRVTAQTTSSTKREEGKAPPKGIAKTTPVETDGASSPQTPQAKPPATAEALASEPEEAQPLAAAAEKLGGEIERRRREERERREMKAHMARIRFRLLHQFRQNEAWYQDAIDEEVEYVRNGEEHFEDKEYRDAKDSYLAAIEITYPQWIFTEKIITMIKTDSGWHKRENFEPSFQKKIFHLSTEYTRLALTRLALIDRLIAEYDLIRARLKADAAYEAGDIGKAYRRYTDALEIARKMGRSAFAMRYADEITEIREILFAEAAMPLGMAEAALAASRPSAALAALDEFKQKYAALAFIPALKERYLALTAHPKIKHERREQSALKKIAIGDAAVAREDYRTAVRWYRRAAALHAGTQGASLAGQKRDALLADPAVVAAIERQEIEHTSKAMIARAETFASWGKVAEAIEVYDELIEAYPDTPWAEEAMEARKALEEIEKNRPFEAEEPHQTEMQKTED